MSDYEKEEINRCLELVGFLAEMDELHDGPHTHPFVEDLEYRLKRLVKS